MAERRHRRHCGCRTANINTTTRLREHHQRQHHHAAERIFRPGHRRVEQQIVRDVADGTDQQQLRPEATKKTGRQRERPDDTCHHVSGDVYFSS